MTDIVLAVPLGAASFQRALETVSPAIEDVEHLITAPDVAYLNGPPRYARGTTDGGENLANGLTGGSECA